MKSKKIKNQSKKSDKKLTLKNIKKEEVSLIIKKKKEKKRGKSHSINVMNPCYIEIDN